MLRIYFLLFLWTVCGAQPNPTDPPVDPLPLDLIHSFSVMCVLFLLTVVGCIVLIYLQYCCASVEGGRRRSNGLDSSAIEAIPTVAYIAVKIGKGSDDLECAVCLAEFEERDSIRVLPRCDHAFHPDCIDAWLASRATCPVCRADLRPGRPARGPARSRNRERVVVEIYGGGSRMGGVGKLPRSHSTGHSLVGDVRAELKRSASDNVIFHAHKTQLKT